MVATCLKKLRRIRGIRLDIRTIDPLVENQCGVTLDGSFPSGAVLTFSSWLSRVSSKQYARSTATTSSGTERAFVPSSKIHTPPYASIMASTTVRSRVNTHLRTIAAVQLSSSGIAPSGANNPVIPTDAHNCDIGQTILHGGLQDTPL